jgi:hypothetical protein
MEECNMALEALKENYKIGSDLVPIGGQGEKL